VVRHAMIGLGLGGVLSAKRPTLKLCQILGLTQSRVPVDPGAIRVIMLKS